MARHKSTDNREHIIQCASRLFCQQGISNTSLADIAKAADISKGTLYYYYTTKNELIFDITEKHIERITAEIFRIMDQDYGKQPPAKILEIVFNAILSDDTRNRLHLYLVQEAVTGNEQLKQRFQARYPAWRALIEEGLNRLTPNHHNPKALAKIIVALLDGLIIQTMMGIHDVPVSDIIIDILKQA